MAKDQTDLSKTHNWKTLEKRAKRVILSYVKGQTEKFSFEGLCDRGGEQTRNTGRVR